MTFSLKHFLLQQRVFVVYRAAIRASRCVPDQRTRAETLAWFRGEIQRNRHLTDIVEIEHKLNVASRDIRRLFPHK